MSDSKISFNTDYAGLYFMDTYKPNVTVFHVPSWLSEGKPSPIHHTLGKLKLKNDGRWDWFAFKLNSYGFHTWNEGKPACQGVVATYVEGLAKLISFLPENVDRTKIMFLDKNGNPKSVEFER